MSVDQLLTLVTALLGLNTVIMCAGVGWAFKATGRLSHIETLLKIWRGTIDSDVKGLRENISKVQKEIDCLWEANSTTKERLAKLTKNGNA